MLSNTRFPVSTKSGDRSIMHRHSGAANKGAPRRVALVAACFSLFAAFSLQAQVQPALSISDATVLEGNSGTTNAIFTVTKSGVSVADVTVRFATADATATATAPFADYIAQSGTLTFTAAETTKTITVVVNGDTIAEPDENFHVDLTNPTNATLADALGVGNITNDDNPPQISISDVSMNEGNSGTTNFNLAVTLSNMSSSTVTVNYATADGSSAPAPFGTATAPSDYTQQSGTLTFAPYETTKTITVAVNGDTTVEPDETFSVNLSLPTNATILKGTGVGTILDDDSSASLSIDSVVKAEGNTGTTNFVFTVTKSGSTSKTVTVRADTADGTATAASGDYTARSNVTLTFLPSETTKTFTVAVAGDTTNELDETFSVILSNPVNAPPSTPPPTITTGTGTGTIQNDDSTLSINNVSMKEGNTGTTPPTDFAFIVTRVGTSSLTVSVNVATSDGTGTAPATAPSDYTALSTTVTFAPGETTKTVTVAVNGDTVAERDETFNITLSAPMNGQIPTATATGVGTIQNDDAPPTLSINDVTMSEGNSGTTNFVFTVTKSGLTDRTVTVNFVTADGTATAPSDYTSQPGPLDSGSLSFAPAETTKTITIAVNGDTTPEADETFFVDLSGPVNATISKPRGLGTILDDDSAQFSINDVTQNEGNSGTTNFVFTVTKSGSTTRTVTVNFATANGSAIAPGDYTAQSGTLTFLSTETTKTITVAVNGDLTIEPNETFTVNLSAPSGGSITRGTGTGTILDDDSPISPLSIDDVTRAEGNSGTTDFIFTVTKSGSTSRTVTVNFATADGTATAGTDYVAQSGTLTFAPGEATKTITVQVVGDTVVEPDETFSVNLSGATNASITKARGIGTILDDDTPAITISDASVKEGNSGTVNADFTVTKTGTTVNTVTVNFATANGTAIAPGDYTSQSGTLSFAPNESTKTISVAVIGDIIDEDNETFFVNLSGATNSRIAKNQGVGTIIDDDGAPTIVINDVSVKEGDSGSTDAVFTVTLSNPSSFTVTVNYATADGTATAGADYTARNGTLTFAPSEITKTISVPVLGDTIDELNETFFVNLSGAANASIAKGQGVGTIIDDDGAPTMSINDVSVVEGNSGTTNAVFTVTLSNPSGLTVTVGYATEDGTATAGADYMAQSGTLTFAPSVTTQTITIAVIGDTIDESDETFKINLSGAANASIAKGQGVGTIIDDDGDPTIRINDVSVTEGNSGTVDAVFTVSLSNASSFTVTVDYATADGTATAGSDYMARSGTLTFAPSQTSRTITVPVIGDTTVESDETFTVNLSNPTKASITKPQGIGTIINDDGPAPTIAAISPSAVCQGGPDFTLTVDGSGFVSGSVVQVDNSSRPTTFVTSTRLTATITASDIAAAGTRTIKVVNPDTSVSNTATLTVAADTTAPVVTAPAAFTTMQTMCPAPGTGGATGSTSPELASYIAGGSATDNCTQTPSPLAPQAGGTDVTNSTVFPAGSTTVTFRFRDNAGNTGTATSTVTVRLLGDLNADNAVDAVDLNIMANYLVGNVSQGTPPFTAPLSAADLNGDGKVDAIDFVIHANYLVGNITCLPAN